MRSHVTLNDRELRLAMLGFNTASGMRSHVTTPPSRNSTSSAMFQYRKRYEVTCDEGSTTTDTPTFEFQYRKRYEVTCD